MITLTKADLVEMLHNKVGLNKREAKNFVEYFFESISQTLETNNQVKLSKFGNFSTRFKRARPGRNPKTGEIVEIGERTVVRFHAGLKLKALIEQYKGENGEKQMEDGTFS